MSFYEPHVIEIAREMFADADAEEARAVGLPRWRWLKRHNLRGSAHTTRIAAALFMKNHEIPTVAITVRF